MIKNVQKFREFEDQFISQEHLPYKKALQIYEGLHKEAVALGILPSKNPLEGIEVNIQIAKILNSCSKNS